MIKSKTGFTMPYLTFLYTSFEKIFCQNFVKKNRKYVMRVYVRNIGIKPDKRRGKYAPYVR